jgi:hypothetical protein
VVLEILETRVIPAKVAAAVMVQAGAFPLLYSGVHQITATTFSTAHLEVRADLVVAEMVVMEIQEIPGIPVLHHRP